MVDGPVPLTKVLYTATATAVGGRTGTAQTDDGRLSVRLAPPRKNVPDATNPEQLFAAGFAACFTSALAEVAAQHQVDTTSASVACRVQLGTTATPAGYGLAVTLSVGIPGVPHAQVEELVAAAAAVCPYAQAVRGNIEVHHEVLDLVGTGGPATPPA
jgi:osmotically inducible protein OsmC